jgi:ubiquinone biosynthesis UbiH/UbiF/VisC/COQ6 family hydroxylase
MDFDLIIVGGGLVGASLAMALRKSGLRIAVLESQPPRPDTSGWDARVYAISGSSRAFLMDCAAWNAVDTARVCPVERMRIYGPDGNPELEFSAYDAGLLELAVIVENRELQRALWQAMAQEPAITVVQSATCTALTVDDAAATIELADSTVFKSRLAVGADGGDSWVRAQAGIDVDLHVYHQRAVVANFACTEPHRGIAHQWFRRDGVLAMLPLPGERASMVWSCANAMAGQLAEMNPQELAERVAAATDGVLGALELITPPAAFPLRLQRVERLIAPRVALVGDAAHLVHPLAGQGVNLGFGDARALAQVLVERGPETDCGRHALLRRYERARREDIAAMQWMTDGLQKVFSSPYPGLAKLSTLGMRMVDRQPWLKNLLVQHAVG